MCDVPVQTRDSPGSQIPILIYVNLLHFMLLIYVITPFTHVNRVLNLRKHFFMYNVGIERLHSNGENLILRYFLCNVYISMNDFANAV